MTIAGVLGSDAGLAILGTVLGGIWTVFKSSAWFRRARQTRYAKALQALMDRRTQAIICSHGQLGAMWYAGSSWRKWSEELFTAAAEVAARLGSTERAAAQKE